MTSLTRIAYGSRTLRHGSSRPFAEYHVRSARFTETRAYSARVIDLLPGERLLEARDIDLVDPPALPDALGELCKLTGVERPEEIGENGPAVAARVTDANADEPELRLFEVVFGR